MSITEKRKIEIEQQRRAQIMSVALGLFFNKGYKNTTMSDIAQSANISKGLIYHYFKSKAELLFSYQSQLDACLDEINSYSSAKEAIQEFGRRFLLDELDESGYIPPLQIYVIVFVKGEMDDPAYMSKNPLYQDFGRNFFGPLFEKGMKAGEFKRGNAALFGDVYWHYLLGTVLDIAETHGTKKKLPDLFQVISLFEV